MPLSLVVGPANAAKAGEVFGAFRRAAADRPVLVVPTRADVAHYERELAGEGAIVGGRVTAFGGLVAEVARRAGLSIRPVGPVTRERLVARAVERAGFRELADSAGSPGFRRAAVALMGELGAERVDPAHFAEALRSRGRYGYEVAALYAAYREELTRLGRDDEETHAWRALDALRERPGAWGGTPVFLYGFDDLTRVQRDAVETLAGPAGAPVTVSLPYEPRTAFAGRAGTYEELRPAAGPDGVRAVAASEAFYAPSARRALHHLERHLFEPDPPPPVAAGDAVRLLEPAGARAEAELLAQTVRELRDEGIPAEEIAVVVRSPRRSGALLERVFTAAGLEVAGERRVRARDTSLGRGLLGLVRTALLPDAAAADVLAWLRSPGQLRVPELADRLEQACRREGIASAAGARARWEEDHPGWSLDAPAGLARAAEAGPAELVAEVRRRARALFAAPFRQAAAAAGGPVSARRAAPVAAAAGGTLALFDPAAAPEPPAPPRGTAPLLGAAERADARLLAALEDALTELEALAAGHPRAVAPADVLQTIEDLEVEGGEPARPGAVLVTDPLGIRARRFRAVLVAGLTAGEFPQDPRPEPFLPEDVRRELAEQGIRLARGEDELAEERYLLYACLSRATDRVVLSAPTADEEGNVLVPSPFVDDVREVLELDPPCRRTLADVVWPPGRDAAAAGAPADAPLGDLRDPRVRALARHSRRGSAGALETYAHCPVAWLVDKELQPAPFEPDPDAIRRGGYVHAVLERLHTDLKAETGTGRITPANLGRARELLDRALDEEAPQLLEELPPIAARSVSETSRADLTRYLEQAAREPESAFEPELFELAFGLEDDPYPPLVLGEGDEALEVCGRIDRVDLAPDGRAIVRDYKSGRVPDGAAVDKWAEGRSLQIALYLIAVRELLGRAPAGGLYQPLRGGDVRPRGLVPDDEEHAGTAFVRSDRKTPEETAELLAAVEARARELAASLRAGRLEPTPKTCGFRGGCAFPGICRSGAA